MDDVATGLKKNGTYGDSQEDNDQYHEPYWSTNQKKHIKDLFDHQFANLLHIVLSV